jgi:hypothetical protein
VADSDELREKSTVAEPQAITYDETNRIHSSWTEHVAK